MSQKNEYCMAKYACYMSNISGAVIFSVSAGLGEVLISPVIAAIFPCLGIVMILCMKRYFKKAVR